MVQTTYPHACQVHASLRSKKLPKMMKYYSKAPYKITLIKYLEFPPPFHVLLDLLSQPESLWSGEADLVQARIVDGHVLEMG